MVSKTKESPHLRVRVSPSLYAKLEKAREKNERTLTGEITSRLEQSFAREVDRQREKTYVEKDAEVLNLMIGNNEAAADLLRKFVFELQSNRNWERSDERKKLAQVMYDAIYPEYIRGDQ